MSHQRPAATVIVLVALLATVLGAGVASVLLLRSDVDVVDSAGQGLLPATASVFDDARTVSLTPVVEPGTDIVLQATGIVTSLTCDEVLVAGSTPVAVSGAPVLAISSSTPMWRDIAIGDRGQDVQSLQAELARLGLPVTVDGIAGPQTMGAFSTAIGSGGSSRTGVTLGETLWLPAPEVSIDACALEVAAVVAPGSVLATTADTLEAVKFPQPTGTIDGARLVAFGDESAAVELEAGRIVVTDSAVVSEVAASQEFGLYVDGEAVSIPARYALADPLSVLEVPPSALSPIDDGRACVHWDGTSHAVTILASRLGIVIVAFDEEPQQWPQEVDAADSNDPWECAL